MRRPPLVPDHSASSRRGSHRNHSLDRARRRYGLELSEAILDGIAARIAAGGDADHRPLRADRDHPRRWLWAVRLDGEWLPAVYDERTRMVVSFLPARAIDHYRAHLGGR